MPEGPEVTVVKEDLDSYLSFFYLTKMNIYSTSRYRDKAPDNYLFVEKSLPLKLESVKSKGKLIYWVFEKNITLLNTLGMSGIWTLEPYKHTSICLEFSLKNKKRKVYFVDQRHFGTLKFLNSQKDLDSKLKNIGPDILNDKTISLQEYKKRFLKYKHYNITKALMDQKIISGVGNYLKAEILYDAKISPLRKIEDLSEEELKKLFNSSKKIINRSYMNKGVSIKDFKDVEGKKGKHQFKLQVYCRDKDKFGNKVQALATPDKRTTYWVPEVQN